MCCSSSRRHALAGYGWGRSPLHNPAVAGTVGTRDVDGGGGGCGGCGRCGRVRHGVDVGARGQPWGAMRAGRIGERLHLGVRRVLVVGGVETAAVRAAAATIRRGLGILRW